MSMRINVFEVCGLLLALLPPSSSAVAEVPHRCQAFDAIAARKWWWHCSASILSSDTAESLWQSLRASSVTHRNALISDFRLYISHTKVGVSGTLGSTRVLPNVPPPGPPKSQMQCVSKLLTRRTCRLAGSLRECEGM